MEGTRQEPPLSPDLRSDCHSSTHRTLAVRFGTESVRRRIWIQYGARVKRSLLEDIKTKQLKWYGHVQRMEEGRLPKKAMKWSPPGRRNRGRPKLTWAEEIRGLMEEKGLMEEDWNDRDTWKKKKI